MFRCVGMPIKASGGAQVSIVRRISVEWWPVAHTRSESIISSLWFNYCVYIIHTEKTPYSISLSTSWRQNGQVHCSALVRTAALRVTQVDPPSNRFCWDVYEITFWREEHKAKNTSPYLSSDRNKNIFCIFLSFVFFFLRSPSPYPPQEKKNVGCSLLLLRSEGQHRWPLTVAGMLRKKCSGLRNARRADTSLTLNHISLSVL